jgi:hypothetical protein
MKNIIYLFTIALLALSFASCDENSFSQVVTIDVPEHTPRPVLNLQVEAGQERELSLLVTNSKGILDPESTYDIPTDAEVVMYRNSDVFANLTFSEQTLRYEAFLENPFPNQGGDTYLIEANIPAFGLVQVSQTMPVKPKIEKATFEREGTIDEGGFRVDELVVDIIDQEPGRTNYYGLRLFQVFYNIDSTTGDTLQISKSRLFLDSNDPLLTYGASFDLIFNDEAFSAGAYQARCYTYFSFNQDNINLEVELYQLSEDAYLYDRSLEQYQNSIGNPFAEPVTVHSNIPGGYGIFSLINKDVYLIED